MLAIERKKLILDYLKKRHYATVSELADSFHVHEATIRRDLSAMQKEGVLFRTHGGVTINEDDEIHSEPSFNEREIAEYKEKQQIGLAAAEMIQDGDHILLDSGTTTLHIAKSILDKKDLTVVTNDINIASTLRNQKDIKVIVTGGILFPESYMLNGKFTDDVLQSLNLHKAFVGTPAIHFQRGITHFDDQLVSAKQNMIAAAREIIAVADHTKFGRVSLHKVADVHQIDCIITDRHIDPEELQRWQDINMDIHLA